MLLALLLPPLCTRASCVISSTRTAAVTSPTVGTGPCAHSHEPVHHPHQLSYTLPAAASHLRLFSHSICLFPIGTSLAHRPRAIRAIRVTCTLARTRSHLLALARTRRPQPSGRNHRPRRSQQPPSLSANTLAQSLVRSLYSFAPASPSLVRASAGTSAAMRAMWRATSSGSRTPAQLCGESRKKQVPMRARV